mmetsp:Transcript_110761/g.320040  ORF Transcript_110761/g.320040 Transcript_110761/m.320040 type:complete len:233 (-) Transcript_110761:63-761(-)
MEDLLQLLERRVRVQHRQQQSRGVVLRRRRAGPPVYERLYLGGVDASPLLVCQPLQILQELLGAPRLIDQLCAGPILEDAEDRLPLALGHVVAQPAAHRVHLRSLDHLLWASDQGAHSGDEHRLRGLGVLVWVPRDLLSESQCGLQHGVAIAVRNHRRGALFEHEAEHLRQLVRRRALVHNRQMEHRPPVVGRLGPIYLVAASRPEDPLDLVLRQWLRHLALQLQIREQLLF